MSDDCSLSVVCDVLELPILYAADVAGNATNIPNEELSPSVSSLEDCTCSNNLELNSNCFGNVTQSSAMGEYEPICKSVDGTVIYIHTNPLVNMYIYHINDTALSVRVSPYFS